MENNNWKGRTILFLISQCITLFGSTLVQMAIVWYVTLETASGVWVAAFFICSYLPQFLISFIGGVWADRYNRKKLIILADAMIAVATIIMFIIMPSISSKPLLLGVLLTLSVIRSLGAGVQMPAVNAVIPQLVPQEHLMRYNGINATMQAIVQFAAPAAAGLLLTVSSLHNALIVDIITAAVGIALLSYISVPTQSAHSEKPSLFEDMKAGIRYAFANKLIGKLLVIYGLFVLLCVPAGFMAGLLVARVYGDSYWYLTAVELAGFGGMAAGGALMGVWGGFSSRIKTLAVGFFVFGAMAIGMGLAQNFILYLAMMIIYGVALVMAQTATTTLIQTQAEEEVQGRVFGLMGSVYAGFLPIGMIICGPLADIISLQSIMVGSGVALIAIAAYVQIKLGGER